MHSITQHAFLELQMVGTAESLSLPLFDSVAPVNGMLAAALCSCDMWEV